MSKRKKTMSRRSFTNKPPCHSGPVEVFKNLFCGSEDEALVMAAAPIKVDTLVPLHILDAKIWDLGFRGEILYYPIKDYGTLHSDVLDDLVLKILDRLNRGKKVGLFCVGGHGRTGYVASVVLGKLGYKDPIQFLRANYCPEAIESNTQIQHIADVLGKPELVEKYEVYQSVYEGVDGFGGEYYGHYDFGRYFTFSSKTVEEDTCGECLYFNTGRCRVYKDFLFDENDLACDEFVER